VVDLVAAAVEDSCSCIGSAKCCGGVASCVRARTLFGVDVYG
jgi:hypothetical protein